MSLSDPPVQGGPAQRLREPGRAQLLAAGADFQAADAKQLGPQAHGACSSASETRGGQPHRLNGAPGSARSAGCPWASVEAGATGRTRHTRPHSCRGAGSAAQGVRSHVRSAEVRWESGACTEPPLGSPTLTALTALTPPRRGACGGKTERPKVKRVREIRDIRREYNQTGEPTSGRTAGLRRGCQREQSPPGGKRRGPEAGSDLAGPGDGEQGGAGGPAGCRSQTMKSALNINYASEDGAEAPLGGTRGLGTAAPPAPLSPRLPAGLRETGAGSPAGTRR